MCCTANGLGGSSSVWTSRTGRVQLRLDLAGKSGTDCTLTARTEPGPPGELINYRMQRPSSPHTAGQHGFEVGLLFLAGHDIDLDLLKPS